MRTEEVEDITGWRSTGERTIRQMSLDLDTRTGFTTNEF